MVLCVYEYENHTSREQPLLRSAKLVMDKKIKNKKGETKMKKLIAMLLSLVMILSLFAGCGNDKPAASEAPKAAEESKAADATNAPVKPVVIKYSTAESPTSVLAQVMTDLIAEVDEKSNGTIIFEPYYSNELGSLADVTEQMTLGGNLMANASGDFYATYGCPDILSSALFYAVPDKEALQKLNASDLFASWCDQIEEASGIKILCCNWAAAPRNIISTNLLFQLCVSGLEFFDFLRVFLRRRWQRLRLFQDGVFQIGKPPLSIPKPTTFYIPRLFQLLNGSANTVYTILADAGKPLCGIIPIFWQGQHERKQTFCFQGKLPVTQMMVCHDGVISGFVYTKYCDNSSPLFAGAFGGAESAPAHNGPGLRFRR